MEQLKEMTWGTKGEEEGEEGRTGGLGKCGMGRGKQKQLPNTSILSSIAFD